MTDHPIVEQNRLDKATRLANAVLVLHKALAKNQLVPESPADYARSWPQAVGGAVGWAIGEQSPPNTSVPVCLALLEQEAAA